MSDSADAVIQEIRRRAGEGRSLGSGANRGDWLYSRAVSQFGSWGAAVSAAGFAYGEIVQRPMTKAQLLRELRALVASGAQLRAGEHRALATAALRLFGGWRAACRAAGDVNDGASRWPPAAVVDAIRRDIAEGRPVTANQVRRRDENLYMAGRRRFGTWQAALAAAGVSPRRVATGRRR